MQDKEAIIALLRACVEMKPAACHATLKEALRQMDQAVIERAIRDAPK